MNKQFFMTIATALLAIQLQTYVMAAEPKSATREENTQKLQAMSKWLLTQTWTSQEHRPYTHGKANELLLLVNQFKSEYNTREAKDGDAEECSEEIMELVKLVDAFKAEATAQDKVWGKVRQLRKRRYQEVLAEAAKFQRTSGQEVLNALGGREIDWHLLHSLDSEISQRTSKAKFDRDDFERHSNY